MALDKVALETAIAAALKPAIADAFATAHGQGKTSIDTALGNSLADAIASAVADSIDPYVKDGEVAFASGTIEGACPSGGGPLTLGLGNSGTIA